MSISLFFKVENTTYLRLHAPSYYSGLYFFIYRLAENFINVSVRKGGYEKLTT